MKLESFELFGPLHFAYLAGWLVLWIGLPYTAVQRFGPREKRITAWLLAILTVVQESIDYLIRMSTRELTLGLDLPLHYCHLAQIWSVILLFVRQSLLFELTYFWGLAGALQAMLTPDVQAFDTGLSLFLFFAHHGLIILIVLWLVFVKGNRCRPWAVIRVLVATNLIMVPVYLLDVLFGANYMYLFTPPQTSSPFISGPWPIYIFKMEVVAIIMMTILQLPMTVARIRLRESPKAESVRSR